MNPGEFRREFRGSLCSLGPIQVLQTSAPPHIRKEIGIFWLCVHVRCFAILTRSRYCCPEFCFFLPLRATRVSVCVGQRGLCPRSQRETGHLEQHQEEAKDLRGLGFPKGSARSSPLLRPRASSHCQAGLSGSLCSLSLWP